MKDIRVVPGKRVTSVCFDGMSWPLPNLELLDRLTHGPLTEEDARAAVHVLRAYVQMISDPAKKRQRVIAALRAAREKGERDDAT
jgi:hypothetical protein